MNVLAADGGGTKLNALWLDGGARLIARGRGGGVNLTQTPREAVRAHVEECLDMLFRDGAPDEADCLYAVFVGPRDVLTESLKKRTRLRRIEWMDEAAAGLLAGAVRTEGLLALSGTGSDVFFLEKGGRHGLGGQGPILGDDGSGAWMGQQAARAVVRDLNGWGRPTRMTPLLMDEWQARDVWDLVRTVHGSAAPFGLLSSLTRLIGQAAREGDEEALGIVREAGRLMAVQMRCLLGRLEKKPEDMNVTLCGGAWKTHPEMRNAFEREMRKTYPDARARRPMFEHVCAGAVRLLLEKGLSREEVIRTVRENLPEFCAENEGGEEEK